MSVKPSSGYTYVSTLAVTSGNVRIDGNFDDWMAFGLKGEGTGDVKNRNTDTPYSTSNRNVDINGYQVKATPTSGPNHLSFMVSTVGKILNGLVVGNPQVPGISEPGIGGGGEPLDTNFLEDRAIIYIDRDPTFDPVAVTGARILADKPTFGADFYLDIHGKFGRVIGTLSKVYQFQLNQGWREMSGTVNAATDYHRLEAQIPLGTIGMNPSVTPETYIVTTDWMGNYDETQPYLNRAPTASTIYAQEESVAPNTVLRGQTNVPVLRIEVENRESRSAYIESMYASLVGTTLPENLDAIHIWVGGPEEEFNSTTFRELDLTSAWLSNEVKMTFNEQLRVSPKSLSTLFLCVDISDQATTLNWFDLQVLPIYGIISSSEVVIEAMHDSYKLIRIWNTDGGRFTNTVALNEIYFMNDSSKTNWWEKNQWIELINPTTSNVSLNGWKIYLGRDLIHTFGSTWIVKDNGKLVVNITNVNITAEKKLYLADSSDTDVSTINLPTTVDIGESYSRWRKNNSQEPYGTPIDGAYAWYIENVTTPNGSNDMIPEFSDIAYPLVATLVTFAVVRRRSHPRRQQETE